MRQKASVGDAACGDFSISVCEEGGEKSRDPERGGMTALLDNGLAIGRLCRAFCSFDQRSVLPTECVSKLRQLHRSPGRHDAVRARTGPGQSYML